ncbi:hypothetical protein [Thalassoroseus pseudoceratinae]|uniref:hypothetical protein n=1 Tax=Thalassoroseus pseudoceratinae TaxID=2713176 RepID=UPI0014207D19|nr:hypothetical protein [Thalassoroseus pseudoceratinae]
MGESHFVVNRDCSSQWMAGELLVLNMQLPMVEGKEQSYGGRKYAAGCGDSTGDVFR